MRKKLLLLTILIVLLIPVGCGERAAKVDAFNNYFKNENEIADTLTENFKSIEEDTNSNQNLDEFIKQFSTMEDYVKSSSEDISNIDTPKELEKYKQKELGYLNQLTVLINQAEEALKNKDLNSFNDTMTKIDSLKNELKSGEIDKMIEDAAKKAGLEAIRNGEDKYIFK